MNKTATPYGSLHDAHLPNGLRVLVQNDPQAPFVATCLRIDAGSWHESPSEDGLAHLTEHVVLSGALSETDSPVKEAWCTGGWLNAHTEHDCVMFQHTGSVAGLERRLRCDVRLLENEAEPAISTVSTQLRIVLRERAEVLASPVAQITDRVLAGVFPAHHPYARRSLGSAESLSTFGAEDVARFRRHWYRPSNSTLAVVGPVEADRTIAYVHQAFTNPSSTAQAATLTASRMPMQRGPGGYRLVTPLPSGRASRVTAAYLVPPATSPHHLGVRVIAAALGQGRGGHLFRDLVREKGLAQPSHKFASVWNLARDNSLMLVSVDGRPAADSMQLITGIDLAIERLANEWRPVDRDRAVTVVERTLTSTLDNPLSRAATIANATAWHGDPMTSFRELSRLREFTADQLTDLTAMLFRHAGPSPNIEPALA